MYTVVKIANVFVNKGIGCGNPVTQMQLQKLLYFANGVILAQTNGKKCLIDEKFEAWEFGPVIPSLYQEFRQFGIKPITPENDILRIIGKENTYKEPKLKKLEIRIINEIWDKFKNIEVIQLTKWTHKPDSAWSKVYKQGVKNKLIESDIINDFKPLLTKNKIFE